MNLLTPDALHEQFIRDRLMSDRFLEFIDKNLQPYNRLLTYYRCAVMEIETKFRVLNEELGLKREQNPIESIKTRIKSDDSLMRKIRDRHVPLNLEAIQEEIRDIAGVRVICSFQDDIYMLADCLMKQDDIKTLEIKDYIKNPKPSGYRSLHLIVEVPIFLQNEKRSMKVEIQLRTIAMDFWASLEHKLMYKKNIPEQLTEQLRKELAECAEINHSLDERMQMIRKQINDA